MKIAEIFDSVHGEINGHHQGRMCTFIRISGCNLKCSYCDTPHTQDSNYGTELSILQIIQRVKDFGNQYVCITGGEPLLNKNRIRELLYYLWQNNFKISIETNGTIDINPFFRFVDSFVIDYKTGIKYEQICHTNYLNLRKTDVIKFVVDENTIQEAIEYYTLLQSCYAKSGVSLFSSDRKPIIAFSPILSKNFTTKTLYYYLKNQNITNVIISVQLHKLINFQ